jgi:predicted transcriptional regulator
MKSKAKSAKKDPVVQTVKLDDDLFVRLKIFSAKNRRTHQDILETALREYLRKMRG